MINPSLSDQSIQAYLTSSHGRPGGSRPLANYLHTPKSIVGSSEGFRHDMAQVMLLLGAYNNLGAMSASKRTQGICILCNKTNTKNPHKPPPHNPPYSPHPQPPPPPPPHLHCQLQLKPASPITASSFPASNPKPIPNPVCSLPLSSCLERILYKAHFSALWAVLYNLIELSELVRPQTLQAHYYFRGLKHQTYLSHASRVSTMILSLHWPA